MAITFSQSQSSNQLVIVEQSSSQIIRINGVGHHHRNHRRRVDIVTISFRRDDFTDRRRITSVTVVGSDRPCRHLLRRGRRLEPAVRCLLNHRFELVAARRDVLVFVRVRKRRRF